MVETVAGMTPLVGAKWKDFLRGWSEVSVGLCNRLDCVVGWMMLSVGLCNRLDCVVGWIVLSVGLCCRVDCVVGWIVLSGGLWKSGGAGGVRGVRGRGGENEYPPSGRVVGKIVGVGFRVCCFVNSDFNFLPPSESSEGVV